MRGEMLTEDIDSSMRALERGCKIGSDPHIVSRELATTTWRHFWNQRLRWAQGWTQVSLQHFWPLITSKYLNLKQKIGVLMLFFFREVYPWVSTQILVLIAYWHSIGKDVYWRIFIFLVLSGIINAVGPARILITYHLSHPLVKKWDWFLVYGVFALFVFTEFKNVITRYDKSIEVSFFLFSKQTKITA